MLKLRLKTRLLVSMAALSLPAIAHSQDQAPQVVPLAPVSAGTQEPPAQTPGRANPAPSQNQPAAIGPDIVVTATRQSKGAQSVPISLTAIGGDQLAKQGVTESSQLSKLAPSLYVLEGNSASAPRYAIRGVVATDDGVAATPAVATYIDDVYQSQQFGVGMQIFDLQRIEVLRGPQGTTFGKNTTAGAIAFFSQTPTNKSEGYVTARLGGGDQSKRSLEAAINVPVIDDVLAIRVSGRLDDKGNWVHDIYSGRSYGQGNSASGRFQIRWTPDAQTTVNLTAYGTRSRGDATNLYFGEYLSDPCTNFSAYATCVNGKVQNPPPANGKSIANTDLPTSEDVDNFGVVLRLEHNFGGVSLTSISNYRKTKFRNQYDVDGLPADLYDYYYSFNTKQYGQEVRLAADASKPLSGILGIFYQYDDGADNSRIGSVLNQPNDFLTAYDSLTTTRTAGIFANVTYKFTHALSATVGIRKSSDRRRLRGINDYYFTGDFTEKDLVSPGLPGPSDVRTQYDVRSNSAPWTWDATLNYNPTRSLLLYARAAKGFRSGGFTIASYFSPEPLPSTFKPESIQSYEIGVKSDWFDRRLRINAATFYYDYKDQQVSSIVDAAFVTTNAASSTLKGFELEITAKPVPPLEIRGSVGYSDAKYGKYILGPGQDFSGNQLASTPEWTATGSIAYTVPLSSSFDLRASSDWSYRGRVYFDASNDPLISDKARAFGSLRLALEPKGGSGISVAAFANNITNQRPAAYGYTFQPVYVARVFVPARTYGVEASFRW